MCESYPHFGASLVHLKSVISYCFGFSEVTWFPPFTWRETLPWGVSQPHTVYAANLCLVGSTILHLQPADGVRGRVDGGKPKNKCHRGINHASSLFCRVRPKESGSASAESQPRGLSKAFLCVLLRCRTYTCCFDTTDLPWASLY